VPEGVGWAESLSSPHMMSECSAVPLVKGASGESRVYSKLDSRALDHCSTGAVETEGR
jgi:hypothetical protein